MLLLAPYKRCSGTKQSFKLQVQFECGLIAVIMHYVFEWVTGCVCIHASVCVCMRTLAPKSKVWLQPCVVAADASLAAVQAGATLI